VKNTLPGLRGAFQRTSSKATPTAATVSDASSPGVSSSPTSPAAARAAEQNASVLAPVSFSPNLTEEVIDGALEASDERWREFGQFWGANDINADDTSDDDDASPLVSSAIHGPAMPGQLIDLDVHVEGEVEPTGWQWLARSISRLIL
jgi:hypothetical protein